MLEIVIAIINFAIVTGMLDYHCDKRDKETYNKKEKENSDEPQGCNQLDYYK